MTCEAPIKELYTKDSTLAMPCYGKGSGDLTQQFPKSNKQTDNDIPSDTNTMANLVGVEN